MGKYTKVLASVLSGRSDTNIAFNDLRNLLLSLHFSERIRGAHFIYTKSGVEEILNIQPKGNKAKPYQVKQVRNVIVQYGLGEQNVQ